MRAVEILAIACLAACSSRTVKEPAPTGPPEAGVAVPAKQPAKQGDLPMNLDEVLQRTASSSFATYHPGQVIEAVNALVPLGKEGALAAIDGFLRKQDLASNPQQGLFLVLRVLFDADSHPSMLLGSSRPVAPRSPSALPRFPIMIVEDVPLMLVESYSLRGLPEPVTAHLAYYRAHGTLRAGPLEPSSGPDRMAAYEAMYRAAYGAAPSAAERAFVTAQLDRLKL